MDAVTYCILEYFRSRIDTKVQSLVTTETTVSAECGYVARLFV